MKNDWIEIELGRVSDAIQYGYTAPSSKEAVGPKLLRITDIQDGKVDWDQVPYCIIELEKIKNYLLQKGDLVFARTGATVGKSFLIRTEIPKSIFASYLIRVRVNRDLLEDDFLSYFFNSPNYWIQITENQAGIGQPNVNGTKLGKLSIPIAPLPEQRAIVSKIEELFSELDHSIASFKAAKAKLEIYRQAVLKKAFEGELTKIWRSKQRNVLTQKELLDQIEKARENTFENQLKEWNEKIKEWEINGKTSKKPLKPSKPEIPEKPNSDHINRMWVLPESWVWTQLGYLAFVTKLAGFEYTDYVNYDDSGDLNVIKAENAGLEGFKVTTFSKVKSEAVKNLTRSKIFGGELLVVFVGAGTGNVAVVPRDCNFFLGPNIAMSRPYLDIKTEYLEYFFRSNHGKNLMMATVKAVAQPSISMGTIRQSPVAFPPREEQIQIVQEIETRLSVADKLAETIEINLKKSEALRQSILKKAFEGKLLSEAELEACRKESDWEPAEKLLERIKSEKN